MNAPRTIQQRYEDMAWHALAHVFSEWNVCTHHMLIVEDFLEADCTVGEYVRRIGHDNIISYGHTMAAMRRRNPI